MKQALGIIQVILLLMLSGCALPGIQPAPTATPRPPLADYTDTIATAQAGSDQRALALAYYDRGSAHFDRGEIDQALADYNRSIELDSSNARAFNNRGLARQNRGRIDAALADYSAAIKLDPTYTRAYRNRVLLLEQRGDLRGMAADYAQLAELEPRSRAGYLYRSGSALYELRDFAGARQAYDAALASDPQLVDALYERALISFAEGNPDAAITDLTTALSYSPKAANAYYARGLAEATRGNQSQAIADYSQAITLQPGYPEALLGRASAYQASGDNIRARADLQLLEQQSIDQSLQPAINALKQSITAP